MSKPPTYRWSPLPATHYYPSTSSFSWLGKLPTDSWNLAWIALPDPGAPPPKDFRSALAASLKCQAVTAPGKTNSPILTMRQLLNAQAVGFVYVLRGSKWNVKPPLLDMFPAWSDDWMERAETARSDPPASLERMMNSDASNVEAARAILSKRFGVSTFET